MSVSFDLNDEDLMHSAVVPLPCPSVEPLIQQLTQLLPTYEELTSCALPKDTFDMLCEMPDPITLCAEFNSYNIMLYETTNDPSYLDEVELECLMALAMVTPFDAEELNLLHTL